MLSPVEISSDTISEILYSVAVTGRITESDYNKIMVAMLTLSMDEEELKSVRRMMHFVKRGKISVVKESFDNLELSAPIDYTAELVLPMFQAAEADGIVSVFFRISNSLGIRSGSTIKLILKQVFTSNLDRIL